MSPTVFREKGYRFFFFSREEARMHVHVISGDGEAKYWLEPTIELNKQIGFSSKQLGEIQKLIGERDDEIITAWRKHFGG